MIKFFRKVRQRLLIENKFNKYSIYAIGEIVLVVIGILIALQINNWNNSKSDDRIIQNFMKSIESNIREDLLQLDHLKKTRTDAQRIFPKIAKDLGDNMIVNVDTFSRGLELAISESQFISSKSGFTGVMNSGFIEKVPFNITEKLYKYYFLVDELNRVEIKFNSFCEEMESKLHLSKGVLGRLIEIIEGEQRLNVPLEKYLLVAPLDAIYIRGPYDISQILGIYSQLKVLGKELLTEIEGIE